MLRTPLATIDRSSTLHALAPHDSFQPESARPSNRLCQPLAVSDFGPLASASLAGEALLFAAATSTAGLPRRWANSHGSSSGSSWAFAVASTCPAVGYSV